MTTIEHKNEPNKHTKEQQRAQKVDENKHEKCCQNEHQMLEKKQARNWTEQ